MVVYHEQLRETCAYATVAAVFLGSLVSTAVTDQPDRTGAVIHGALVWVLFSLFSVWMIASGIQSWGQWALRSCHEEGHGPP